MRSVFRAVCFTALVVSLGWAIGPYLLELAGRWSADPAYSHGYLVPLFSLYVLVRRREMAGVSSPAWMSGIAFLVAGAVLELASGALMIRTLAHYALPFYLAATCLGLAGWRGMRWAWPAIAFLFFMVPLPGPLAGLLSHPLQRIATKAGTYVVQLIGVPAVAEGNVILLSDARLGVAEACNGLRMLISFVTFSAGAALLVERKLWEKVVILASAVPIAIAANVARIAVTAAMFEWVNAEVAEKVFHDLAGWLMMPLGLLMLVAELKLLSALFVTAEKKAPLALGRKQTGKPGKNSPPRSNKKTGDRGKAIKVST